MAAAVASTAAAGAYVPLAPVRILDTRAGTGAPLHKIAAHAKLVLQVGGRGGVPSTNVAAAILTVNALNSATAGQIVAYGADTARPAAPTISFVAGKSATALVLSRVSAGGRVTFYNNSTGPVDLIADLSGFYQGGTAAAPGSTVMVSPARTLDTRTGVGAGNSSWLDQGLVGELTWQVSGRTGIPAGATSVLMALTVTNTAVNSNLSAFDAGPFNPSRWPAFGEDFAVSGMSFTAGTPKTNLAVVPLSAGGQAEISTANFSGGATTFQVAADVLGYVQGGVATGVGTYQAVPSMQLVRSRVVPAGTVLPVDVAGPGFSTAFLRVTVTAAISAGAIIAYQHGTVRPVTRNVNFIAGQTVSNAAMVPSSAGSVVDFYNKSNDPVTVTIEQNGYQRGAPSAAGTVWSSGDNLQGTLGAGSRSTGSAIAAPISLSGVTALYSGPDSSFARRSDGSLWAWGKNLDFEQNSGNGLLGVGEVPAYGPTRVLNVSNVIDVAPYLGGVCILESNGTVWGSGDGEDGSLGSATTGVTFEPLAIPGFTGVVKLGISNVTDADGSGFGHCVGIRADGTVLRPSFSGVAPIPGLVGIKAVAGDFALKANGTVVTTLDGPPVAVPGLVGVKQLNGQSALLTNGTVVTLPVSGSPAAAVTGLGSVTSMSNHDWSEGGSAVKSDGSLWTWSSTTPLTRVANIPLVTAVSNSSSSMLILAR